MRETLFRGKRIDNGEWVHGQYLKREYSGFTDNSIWTPKGTIPVKPETIGQFTGLTDKNGKKIFEGDFVRTPYGIGTIYWDEQYLHYYILFDSEDTSGSDTIDVGWSKDLEIIGNIHDNEKLKQ